MSDKESIKHGDVVQIVKERQGFVGGFLLVDEVKAWGVQGFVHHVKSFEESTQIWLRLNWDEIERIGTAVMMPEGFSSE